MVLARLSPTRELVNQIPGATQPWSGIDGQALRVLASRSMSGWCIAVVDLQLVRPDELHHVAKDRLVNRLTGLAGDRHYAASLEARDHAVDRVDDAWSAKRPDSTLVDEAFAWLSEDMHLVAVAGTIDHAATLMALGLRRRSQVEVQRCTP